MSGQARSALAGRGLGAAAGGRDAAAIASDERAYTRHYSARQRHTMQLDYYIYAHDLRKRVLPAGRERARQAATAG